MKDQNNYWTQRYKEERTGWDIGHPSTPLKEYIDQLEGKDISILIPGAGNGYEAEYLWKQGFKNVFVLDISETPLNNLQSRIPDFPGQQLIHGDFFKHCITYDLILEQTFFCSFDPTPENRNNYAKKISELLNTAGKLVGLWFHHPLTKDSNRPFGGNKTAYLSYLSPYFEVITFSDCYNSIIPRQGNELFGIFKKEL